MNLFTRIRRVHSAKVSAELSTEKELIESGKYYDKEEKKRLIKISGQIAAKDESIKIDSENNSKPVYDHSKKYVNIGSNNTKKTGMVESSVSIANRQASNKSQKTTKSKAKKKK